jgi:ferrous iron transport protein B
MGRIGLEGRAFVALLSSFACAVPGIMATRTVPSATQRLVTMLVAPLMTCSARLPVYALLIGAFVPAKQVLGPLGLQGLTLLGLYLLGALGAFVTASVLGRTLVKADAMPFYLELPPYRIPPAKLVAAQVWGAASRFLRRAGTIILAVSIVLWALLTFPRSEAPAHFSDEQAAAYSLEHSAAGHIGHAIEPAIAPLGFDWKIGVGLLASLAAREVIVARPSPRCSCSSCLRSSACRRSQRSRARRTRGAGRRSPSSIYSPSHTARASRRIASWGR